MGLNQESPAPVQYVHNGISTAKYNVITFLPYFLFEMFSRAAYLYFLLQVGLKYLHFLLMSSNGLSHSLIDVAMPVANAKLSR